MADYDLAIVGGGINGTGIARDAAGRGFRVLLVEQDDLAAGTSSASTKLIHGGLRYLEHGWFRLVREALTEREVLLRMAPHLIRPMRFVLPWQPAMRPAWMLRFGLLIYDHLGGRKLLPASRSIDLTRDPRGGALKDQVRRGFEYSDCQTDDSRLVVLTALDAAERGAAIRTRTTCVHAERNGGAWQIDLSSRGELTRASARVLINATGPWVGLFNTNALGAPPPANLRLVKGSHIVVRKLFDHDSGYIFQTPDRRVVFALPFERDFTLVGTTDQNFSGDPVDVSTDPGEINYLCEVVNRHFRAAVSPSDIVWSFAGIRPLYDDGSRKPQDTPRDYVLAREGAPGEPPLLTIYGGKITTYRRLAEAVLDELADVLGERPPWTADSHLPGGDLAPDAVDDLVAATRARWRFLTEAHARRLVGAYGTRAERILHTARSLDDLGPGLGGDLTATEVRYLMAHEWAQTPEDVLWRRSKLGLVLDRVARERLARLMADAGNARAL